MKKVLIGFIKKLFSFKNIIAIWCMVFIPILIKNGAPDIAIYILCGYLVFYLPTNYSQKKLFSRKEDEK